MLTVCACLVTFVALPDFTSIDTYALQDNHTAMTDFYERASANSSVSVLDSTLTVVAIDGCTHDQIAEVLDIVRDCDPRAIGLDVIFYTLDNDSLLRASLKKSSSLLTLPVSVGETLPSESFVNGDSLPLAKFGRPDLAQEHRAVPIRHFYLNVEGKPSFVNNISTIAGFSHNDGAEFMPLRYGAREFLVVDGLQMLGEGDVPVEDFYDKIVLIGTVNDINDMHYTPIDNDMPGVLIHAYSLSTLMSDTPVRSIPALIVYLMALIFTSATIWLCFKVDNHPYANLVSRIIPLGIIVIFIYICYYCYTAHNLYVDFTVVLAMSASGMLCYDIYTGVPALVKIVWRKVKKTSSQLP